MTGAGRSALVTNVILFASPMPGASAVPISLASAAKSNGAVSPRFSSASSRVALDMSEIKRLRRCTSFWIIRFISRCWSSLVAVSKDCTALCSEVSGFFNSWATSAAKRSIVLIRSSNCSVISRKATDRSPISSPRRDRSGMVSSPGNVGEARLNTRMAPASLRTGSVIVLASNSEVIRLTKSAMSASSMTTRRSA